MKKNFNLTTAWSFTVFNFFYIQVKKETFLGKRGSVEKGIPKKRGTCVESYFVNYGKVSLTMCWDALIVF